VELGKGKDPMGLFSRTPKASICNMCSKSDLDGCGSAHNHVAVIGPNEPAWLPPDLRAQAVGEHTYLCVRCDSYPAMKWPTQGGAWASMEIHLGAAHNVGQFVMNASRMNPPQMIRAQ
jgi:hypothetical protein